MARDKKFNNSVVKKIIEFRESLPMGPIEFAKKLRIPYQDLQRYELGGFIPLDFLWKIHEVFDIDVYYFLPAPMDIKPMTVEEMITNLKGTDMEMARIGEDLIDLLEKKNIISISELPGRCQEIISRRKILRQRIQKIYSPQNY